jgi:large subunit ribosomal protein L4
MEAKVYNTQGKEAGKIELPANIFGLKPNADLIHQVYVSMMSNRRPTVADTKGRGEVRGGGKKPWRQKGTGRARHGSRRSPIWVGGGVAHGPKAEKNFTKKINKKMNTKAFLSALSAKWRDGEVIFLEGLNLTAPKTRDAQKVLTALSKVDGLSKLIYKTGKRALLALPAKNELLEKSFRNIKSAQLAEVRNINLVDILNYKYVIFSEPKASLEAMMIRAK